MREENELPSLPGFLDGRRRAPMSRTAGVSEERACEKNLDDVYRGVTSLFGRVLAKFPEIQFSPYFSAFVCLCLGMVSSMTSVSVWRSVRPDLFGESLGKTAIESITSD